MENLPDAVLPEAMQEKSNGNDANPRPAEKDCAFIVVDFKD